MSSFLVVSSTSGGPSVVFEVADVPCLVVVPLNFSHSADFVYDFCPISDPDVGPSVLVCDVEHTSFNFLSPYYNHCNETGMGEYRL